MNNTTPEDMHDGNRPDNDDTDILITGVSQIRISKREKIQHERKKRKLRSELEREKRERQQSKLQVIFSHLQRLLIHRD